MIKEFNQFNQLEHQQNIFNIIEFLQEEFNLKETVLKNASNPNMDNVREVVTKIISNLCDTLSCTPDIAEEHITNFFNYEDKKKILKKYKI